MVTVIDYLTEAPRIFVSSLKNRFSHKKYEGNAEEICRSVVKDCWNGRFFQTSTSNFRQFWSRDFGWCTQSLLKLGYEKEVHQTLRYALNRFIKYKIVSTTISPGGRPWDFPNMAVDSLPWLIHSIKISKFPYYSYKDFLNKQIRRFYRLVINPDTGLVRSDKQFSSMKDFSIRKSSCYDNCMVAMLAKDLAAMKLDNPFKKYKYGSLIKDNFWSGEFFYDDITNEGYVAGDANLFPFVLGIVNNKDMLKSAISRMEEAGLADPFPLKYTPSRQDVHFVWQEFFFRDYESSAIWMHMGPLYVKLLQSVDKKMAKSYQEKYMNLIEHHRGFLEVFEENGRPFGSIFYYCDPAMLWAANYLTL